MNSSSFRQIISTSQKKLLGKLLELSENDETFTLTELEGFLFGLAITPDVIMPGEWMPEIFGGEMPEFENEKQAELLLNNLLMTYNAYNDAFNKRKTEFSF